uniref:Myb-like domain-containing protein n=1 Tax=Araucaria cunninghamii TaxID=56994 RepID=A0A0D6QXM9_ARACU
MQQAAASGQYGVPDVSQFGGGGGGGRTPHGHMLGISQEPKPQQQQQQQQIFQQSAQQQSVNPQQKADSLNDISSTPTSKAPPRNANSFEQLVPSGAFGEEEGLPTDDGGERGGSVGNRWPRQETLALLKIRSEMDATFRDASLKGPLWEDVSRRLAELGYHRSAKKCKEKFENVHKYYKRTKDGRAGRQDGKCYRFFSQLEALHSNNNNNNSASSNANNARNSNNAQAMSSGPGPTRLIQPASAPAMLSNTAHANANATSGDLNRNSVAAPNPVVARHSADFSPGNLSFSFESSDEDEYDEQTDGRKRKRGTSSSARKMMVFFEQLMKQVMEKQEMMQQKFLEIIEKREQDRMIREEAWKRQEMARLNREHEIMAQERALSTSRDAAFIAFLQKVTGQTFQVPVAVPSMVPLAQSTTTINPVPIAHDALHHRDNNNDNNHGQDAGPIVNAELLELSFDPSSNRWPKPEVHALIKLRSGMEPRYQDAGPKGPLWEEISAGMSRLGYNRSAKRCKEKWENINKYFKKVKESNKKRPEDAKTCPYFHQLEQLYRRRIMGGTSNPNKQEHINHNDGCTDRLPSGNNNNNDRIDGQGTDHILAIMPPPGSSSDNNNNSCNTNKGIHTTTTNNSNGLVSAAAIPTSNGGAVQATFYSSPEDDGSGGDQRSMKKPESLVMEDVMDMDDDDMHSGAHHHHHNHEQQSMVDDYDDDKMEAEDSDTNNEQEHNMSMNMNMTTTSTSTSTHGRHSGGVDHLPFAQFVHENRTNSSVAASTAANSFMAMVHRLTPASDPPEFKSSKA